MREVKFRGKSKETGEFVYGSFVHNKFPAIVPEGDYYSKSLIGEAVVWVEDETISQYTGLINFKSKKEIFEGDVVKGYWWENGKQHRHIGVVTCVPGRFVVRGVKQYRGMDDEINSVYEVIGNKWDNPEMVN